MVGQQNNSGRVKKYAWVSRELCEDPKYKAFKSFEIYVEDMTTPRIKMVVSNDLRVTFFIPKQYMVHKGRNLCRLLRQRLNRYMGLQRIPTRVYVKWPQRYRSTAVGVIRETQVSKLMHFADMENTDFTDEEWDKINDALVKVVRRNSNLASVINTIEIVPRQTKSLIAYAVCNLDPHLKVIYLDRGVINAEDAPENLLTLILFHEIICINSWSIERPMVKNYVVIRAMHEWKGSAPIISWMKERGWRFEYADCKVVIEANGKCRVTDN